MEWSRAQILTLIHLYESEECLWNIALEEYKNHHKKQESFRRIGVEMGISVEEVGRKLRSILSQYRRERRKIAEYKMSGSRIEDIKPPKWFAYNSLVFLAKNKPLKKIESTNNQILCEQDIYEEYVEEEISYTDETESENSNQEQTLRHILSTNAEQNIFKSPQQETPKRKRSCDEDNRVEQAYNIMQSLWEEKRLQSNKDEYTSFGEVVGSKIRKLSTQYERSIVQFKINSLLFEAEMGKFKPSESDGYHYLTPKTEVASSSSISSVTQTPSFQIAQDGAEYL